MEGGQPVMNYAVIDDGNEKRIVQVLGPQQVQPVGIASTSQPVRVVPVNSYEASPFRTGQIALVDPLTAILLAPLYIIQTLVMLPVYLNSILTMQQQLVMQQLATPRMPRMVITEVVRDDKGRITQVIERVI